MILIRFILILPFLFLLNACASNHATGNHATGNHATGNHEPSQVLEQQESNTGEAKQLELKAFLNQHGNVSLRINNHSAHNADNIIVGLRMRFSARIVSNFL